jgi:hypothetical protein
VYRSGLGKGSTVVSGDHHRQTASTPAGVGCTSVLFLYSGPSWRALWIALRLKIRLKPLLREIFRHLDVTRRYTPTLTSAELKYRVGFAA